MKHQDVLHLISELRALRAEPGTLSSKTIIHLATAYCELEKARQAMLYDGAEYAEACRTRIRILDKLCDLPVQLELISK